MPNLRRKSSIPTYNDDAVYKSMELQRRNRSLDGAKTPPSNGASDGIPDVLFAKDGRKFYPCAFCCYAFAYKQDQAAHIETCSFKQQEEEMLCHLEPQVCLREEEHDVKLQGDVKRPFNTAVRQTRNQLKTSSIVKVQNGNSARASNATLKPSLARSSFPKIKLEPGIEDEQPLLMAKSFKQITPQYNHRSASYKQIRPQYNNRRSATYSYTPQNRWVKMYVPKEDLKMYDNMYKNSDGSKCTICFKPVTKLYWSRHLLIHSDEKKFVCRGCDKGFGRKDHCLIHENRCLQRLNCTMRS